MTDDLEFDLDALLGPDADPDRRARFVALLSDALADEGDMDPPDTAELMAYLDQGLTEDEKQSFQEKLTKSAIARADMESMAELLETVEHSSARPPRAVMRQATNLMMDAAARLSSEPTYRVAAAARPSPHQPTIWQRFSTPRVKIGMGFAFAALLAVFVWNAGTGTMVSPIASNGPAQDASQQALRGANSSQATPTSPAIQTWGAIALSSSGGIYGSSHGAATEDLARALATADCIARHGIGCKVVTAGKGQCFALAGQAGGAPASAAAENLSNAQDRAMAACQAAQKGAAPCAVTTAFCSGR